MIRDTRRVLGLCSGTSADGIDVALVEVRGRPAGDPVPRLLRHATVPFSEADRRYVLDAPHADAYGLARLHRLLGERLAEAAETCLAAWRVPAANLDLVGSHGQTVAHAHTGEEHPTTLQLGEPSFLAERLGVPVVHDFRQADLAVGGCGAPLVPILDWLLLRDDARARLALNLGGLANVTLVTPELADVRAFDTGPANAPLDAAARRLPGSPPCDFDGAAAARGRVHDDLVGWLASDPRLARRPPRSFDREEFGARLVHRVVERRPDITGDDLVATLGAFVVRSIQDALERFVPRWSEAEGLWISGGGVHNRWLVERLERSLAPLVVRRTDAIGFDADAKEAVLFATLADRHVRGLPGNLPAVTGASRAVVLGKLQPALRPTRPSGR